MDIIKFNNFLNEADSPWKKYFTTKRKGTSKSEPDKVETEPIEASREDIEKLDKEIEKLEREKEKDWTEDTDHYDPTDFIEKLKKKAKKEEAPPKPEDLIVWDTPIENGDYVEIVDKSGLNSSQKEFLSIKPYHCVKNVVNKKGMPYDMGEPHIDIGYRIPFKMSRFRRIDKSSCKYKILFLQFDLQIDLHGEKDSKNFFRGCKTMSELFTVLFSEKFGDDVFVDFSNYEDIHKIKNDYYINNLSLKDYNFVFFGHISNFTPLCKMIVNYLENNKIPYLKYGTYNEFDNKAYEFHLMDSLGYPYIPSIMATKLTGKIINIVEKEFGFPVIVKDVNSNRGEGVYKVDDLKSLMKRFGGYGGYGSSRLMLIQKFIPNDGDYRIITLKKKVQLVIKKERISETEFRANVARGGKAIRATLPTHIIEMCEDISQHLDSDIIGFDIIQNKDTKEYFVMEANAASHFPTFSVISDVNIPEIIVNYIIKKIKWDD